MEEMNPSFHYKCPACDEVTIGYVAPYNYDGVSNPKEMGRCYVCGGAFKYATMPMSQNSIDEKDPYARYRGICAKCQPKIMV
jgi:hypothetical protein